MNFKKSFLTVLCASVFLISSCKEKESEQQQQIPQIPAIKIQSKTVPLSFEFPARAKGYKDTEVRAQVSGILLQRNYVEGSEVKEGDLLFQIDPEPYKAALQQAKGRLADAEAQLKAAEAQWKRIDTLFKEQIVSEKSRDEARAQMDSLRATVESAKGDLKNAQINLEYTTVKAPISGSTSMESQSVGNLIVSNSEASLLTTITQLDPIYIIFSVSDTDVFNMRKMVNNNAFGDLEKGTTIAKIKYSDDTLYEHSGKINFINPTIDAATGSITLRAVFPNPDRMIIPQQFVRIVIEGLSMPNAITVPKEAVMQGAKGAFVYIINDKGQVEIVNVELGLTDKNGYWIIEKGLENGDVILVGALQKIREKMPVKPLFDYEKKEEPKAAEKQDNDLEEAEPQNNTEQNN